MSDATAATPERKYKFLPQQPVRVSPFGDYSSPASSPPILRVPVDSGGKSDSAKKNGGTVKTGADGETAKSIIESIGRDFVRLREKGRSQAWAELEDRLMKNAHTLIAEGMMSPKDWIGLAIDIEQFRKQEQGSAVAAGDWLSNWLSVEDEGERLAKVPESPTLETLPAGPIKPKIGRKPKEKND